MKFLVMMFAFLMVPIAGPTVSADENATYQEVTTGRIAAFFEQDDDHDGLNDKEDFCPTTQVTQVYEDANEDGCNDLTVNAVDTVNNNITTYGNGNGNGNGNGGSDADGDGVENDQDGCVEFAPSIDEDSNGCQDGHIRTIFTGASSNDEYIYIQGIAFVDGEDFDDANDYSINVSFWNETSGNLGLKEGYEASVHFDESANELIGVEDISYGNFIVEVPIEDLTADTKKQDEPYQVNVQITNEDGNKVGSETLYTTNTNSINLDSGVKLTQKDSRVYIEVK